MPEIQRFGPGTVFKIINDLRNGDPNFSRMPHTLGSARRFDEMYPQASGYLFSALDTALSERYVSSIVVITDAQLASQVLKEHDFKSLGTQTIGHRSVSPFRGKTILFENNRERWKQERRAVNPEYSPSVVSSLTESIDSATSKSLDLVLSRVTNGMLPTDWTKFIVFDQTTNLLLGEHLNPDLLARAAQSHTKYTSSVLKPILIGSAPQSLRALIVHGVLNPYQQLLDTIVDTYHRMSSEGILHRVMNQMPEDNHGVRDVAATLLGGTSLYRATIDNTLYFLSQFPDYQKVVREDPKFLRKFIQEVNRMHPPAPMLLRRVNNSFEIGDHKVVAGSVVVIGIFGFGGPKYVERGDKFDPERVNLDVIAGIGSAIPFGTGPRTCIAKHLNPPLIEATITSILDRYSVSCENNPIMKLGGISLKPDKPFNFILQDRMNNQVLVATSSYT